MRKKLKIIVPILLAMAVVLVAVRYFGTHDPAVLNPAGPVAQKERNLIYFALCLSLVVVIPVFTLLGTIAWRYRESNTKATYSPELSGGKVAETVWWVVPGVLILILSVVTWNSSHQLDPFRALVSTKQPLQVQVISLDWKWLFIYPQQNIATVNFMDLPVNTPVDFTITSDTVMNSFWIPRLGGQIYSMPGMSTQLHLMASKTGSFDGSSANISGKGFAGMTFTAHAVSSPDFDKWVSYTKSSGVPLDQTMYNQLAQPSANAPQSWYSSAQSGLYDSVLAKYMDHSMHGMGM